MTASLSSTHAAVSTGSALPAASALWIFVSPRFCRLHSAARAASKTFVAAVTRS